MITRILKHRLHRLFNQCNQVCGALYKDRLRKNTLTLFLKRTLLKKGKIITGLDMDALSLKLIQIRKGPRGEEIINLAIRKYPSPSQEDISKTIRDLLQELKIKPDYLITSIPRHLTTIRYLELPSIKEAELKKMVDFQAVKLIPYSREEMIVGHQIIETDREGYSKVMVVIVHRDVVSKHLEILRGSGLSPESIRLSSQAICNFYFLSQEDQNTINGAPIALVDIDFSLTNIEVVHQGRLIFSRSFPLGITHLLEEQKRLGEEKAQGNWKRKLMDEMKQSFTAYKREGKNEKITKMVLGRGAVNFPGLDRELEEEFSLPVEIIDPLANLSITEGVSLLQEIEGKEVSLLTALGLAAAGRQMDINLLPPDIRQKRKRESRRKDIISTLALSTIALLLISTIFLKKIYDRERYLDDLNYQFQKTKPLATRVEVMKKRIQIIRDQLNEEGSSLDILYELYRIIPKEISLTIFNFDKDKLVTLKGTSSAMSDVFKLITTLEKSTYFENVEIKYATRRKVRGKEITDFLIHCSLTPSRRKKN